VVRGDALRILNTVAGIRTAEVNKIYRQKIVGYRDAVTELSKGNMQQAFERLEGLGAIKTIQPTNPNEALVEDYIAHIKKGKTALVISPTHKQSDAVTSALRERLKALGLIGKKESSHAKGKKRHDGKIDQLGDQLQFVILPGKHLMDLQVNHHGIHHEEGERNDQCL